MNLDRFIGLIHLSRQEVPLAALANQPRRRGLRLRRGAQGASQSFLFDLQQVI